MVLSGNWMPLRAELTLALAMPLRLVTGAGRCLVWSRAWQHPRQAPAAVQSPTRRLLEHGDTSVLKYPGWSHCSRPMPTHACSSDQTSDRQRSDIGVEGR